MQSDQINQLYSETILKYRYSASSSWMFFSCIISLFSPCPSSIFQRAISDHQDVFQHLVLAVVQTGFKSLPKMSFISSTSLHSALHLTVTTLCKDFSWLKVLSTKQSFCWCIIASCCENIPIAKEQFGWVQLYEHVIACLVNIYNSYCKRKKLTESKCPLLTDGFPQEITHSPSDNIRKYESYM